MIAAMDLGGNPSSVHTEGRKARAAVDKARRQLADGINAEAKDISFTSGGTEAANLGVFGLANMMAHAGNPPVILISELEHAAVRKAALASGFEVQDLPVTPQGALCLKGLQQALSGLKAAPLLCLTLANNESGVTQPMRDAAHLIKAHKGYVFCDGVQALGKIPLDTTQLGADVIGFSAHKVGGPQGTGAVWARSSLALTPHMHGGGQENGKRSGTHNVTGIAGFGAAVQAACFTLEDDFNAIEILRDTLQMRLLEKYPEAVIIGQDAPRLPNTLCIALDTLAAPTRIIRLDLAGIAASAGSACSSGKAKPSGLIDAMGFSVDIRESAIRLSLGYTTTQSDIDRIIAAL